MQPFRLTLKNFRCFSDEHPLVLDVGEGFTAFIGANNAGKSSALRVFYELRHVWAQLHGDAIAKRIQQPMHGFGSGTVTDQDELFHNRNVRDFELVIEVTTPTTQSRPYIRRIAITFARAGGWVGRCLFFDETNASISTGNPNQGVKVRSDTYKLPSGVNYDGSDISGIMRALHEGFYVGAFRNAINQGAGAHYDLQVGTGLVATWNAWKAGGNRAQMNRVLEITETIKDMFGYASLEINAHADDKTLIVVVDRKSYVLSELGAGLAQFVIVLANVAIGRPTLIFIDEPELNLHPALQQRFLRQLAAFATHGVIFATHSLGLARATASRIYSFRKASHYAEVHLFEGTPHLAELMGELSFASYQELGYERVLLVEGITDSPVFREYLRMRNVDHKVMLLPLGGDQLARGDVDRELAELKRLTPSVAAIVDSERSAKDGPPAATRLSFREACERVGIPVLLTERRATENYLSDRAIKQVFGESQRALGPYESRRDANPSWRKDENWQIAAAMTWDEIAETDIGRFLVEHII